MNAAAQNMHLLFPSPFNAYSYLFFVVEQAYNYNMTFWINNASSTLASSFIIHRRLRGLPFRTSRGQGEGGQPNKNFFLYRTKKKTEDKRSIFRQKSKRSFMEGPLSIHGAASKYGMPLKARKPRGTETRAVKEGFQPQGSRPNVRST